jgi:hypothetical protein
MGHQSGASEPVQPAIGYPPSPVPPKARSRKGLAIGLGIAGVVIVLFVVIFARNAPHASAPSGGDKSMPTSAIEPTPTATVPLGFTVYTDPDGHYQLITPNSWVQDSQNGVTTMLGDAPYANLDVTRFNETLSDAKFASDTAAFFHSMSTNNGGSGSYTVVQKPSPVTLSGEAWSQETADVREKIGVQRAVVLVTNHNGAAYVVTYATARSAFAKVDAEDFQPIVQSFLFLS